MVFIFTDYDRFVRTNALETTAQEKCFSVLQSAFGTQSIFVLCARGKEPGMRMEDFLLSARAGMKNSGY